MLLVRVRQCLSGSSPHAFHRAFASAAPSLLPPLPPLNEWRREFPHNTIPRRDRMLISDPIAAQSLAKAFLNQHPNNAKGNVVIEAFPGPGVLSRALLALPASSLHKLIILEDDEGYLQYLKPLQEADPRVTIVPASGHVWDTYSQLEEAGLLKDVEPADWETSIPNLHFVAHLTHNIKGEQLIAQLFRSIPEHTWLFQYGRVPMHILMSDSVWARLSADAGAPSRCKLSVIAEATAAKKHALPSDLLAPYEEHFYPPSSASSKTPTSRKLGQPIHAITSIPHADQIIHKGRTDEWDYCLRKLFVLKNTPLKDAMHSLAPGARSLLSHFTDPAVPRIERVNITKRVRDLNIADWTLIHRAFHKWPFKPSDILITDAFMYEGEN